jgi:hypothetical protein
MAPAGREGRNHGTWRAAVDVGDAAGLAVFRPDLRAAHRRRRLDHGVHARWADAAGRRHQPEHFSCEQRLSVALLYLVSQNAGNLLNEQVTNCISSVIAFRSSNGWRSPT